MYGHAEVVELFAAHGALSSPNNSVRRACPLRPRANCGCELRPPAAAQGRHSLLSTASAGGHTDVLKVLLERGESTERFKKGALSPLHVASFHGRAGAAQLLVEKGADLDVKNQYGETPLDIAMKSVHCARTPRARAAAAPPRASTPAAARTSGVARDGGSAAQGGRAQTTRLVWWQQRWPRGGGRGLHPRDRFARGSNGVALRCL